MLQEQKTTPLTPYTSHTTQTVTCTCKDAQGEVKYLYASKKELSYLLSKKISNFLHTLALMKKAGI